MSTNSTDHKFGLPKPDFQALPKKKAIWPILVVVGIVIILIAAKVGYNLYFKVAKHATSSAETADHKPTNEPVTGASKPSSAQATAPTKRAGNVDETVDPSVGGHEAFERKKNNKVKRSISATQKELAAKQKKTWIKPGTCQELKEPQGIYHLVVMSHLEKRSAMKVVQQLIKKKLGVCLIVPRTHKGEKYYRVTIGHSKTRYEADSKLEKLKPTYNDIFILKY
ncbi:SPOR domain-containing protein [Cardinium endosymbiont of Nabis limbatus]|uniref:SPOR domain-containing protein n=1 Tax=Cardinium endosymbiont of Nabis limbatus TaxID=3066217 RepID=UPI003AF3B772